jgi:hypothetical protein
MGSLRSIRSGSKCERFSIGNFFQRTIPFRIASKTLTGTFEASYDLLHPFIIARTVTVEILEMSGGPVCFTLLDNGYGFLYGSEVLGNIDYPSGHIFLNFSEASINPDAWIVTSYRYRSERKKTWVALEL